MFPIRTASAGAASLSDPTDLSPKKSRVEALRELTANTFKATITKLPDSADIEHLRKRIDATKESKGPSSLIPS